MLDMAILAQAVGRGKGEGTMEDGRERGDDGRGRIEGGEGTMERRRYAGCEPWVFDGGRWRPEEKCERRQIRSHRDLDVYNLAYTLAMEVFRLTASFPKAERYALTDQVRRSSRSVCGNIACPVQ